jgi:hypothetical protein
MFHIGQEVECVDDSPSYYGHPCGLQKGNIYTITIIAQRPDGLGICVAEEPNTYGDIYAPYWMAERFRPIVKRKTDISIFTKMLVPEKVS